ncbi:hypothetical protein [Aquibacillus kalidii]|uniref:hypothetical protein n=1 Tax=Aquibacillus kalidii TaxID=2762597 RepID=UPI002E2E309A|nr:hypothetical protein [Aquibacillus kalidii]
MKQEVKNGLVTKRLVEETYFTVFHWRLDGEVEQQLSSDFLQVSVIREAQQ